MDPLKLPNGAAGANIPWRPLKDASLAPKSRPEARKSRSEAPKSRQEAPKSRPEAQKSRPDAPARRMEVALLKRLRVRG